MKILLSAIIACALFCSCNNASESSVAKTDSSEVKKPAAEPAPEVVSYPYTAEYSTKFSAGTPAHSKLVLDLYKMFETDKLDGMKSLFSDSVAVDFADGTNFHGTADSLISMGKKYRAAMKDYRYEFDAWIPVHSDDKNEDWVLVWSKAYFTYKNGKKDSMRIHEFYNIKNNKITYWSEYNQKFPAPKKK